MLGVHGAINSLGQAIGLVLACALFVCQMSEKHNRIMQEMERHTLWAHFVNLPLGRSSSARPWRTELLYWICWVLLLVLAAYIVLAYVRR